jgi:hypothetical protein
MGDRTWMRITCLEANKKAIAQAIYGWPPNQVWDGEGHDGTVDLYWEEVNYAAWQERVEAAQKGYLFCGVHGSGYDYGSMNFAAIDGLLYEVEAMEGWSIVRIDSKTGEPLPEDLTEVKSYLEAEKRIMEIFAQE